MDSIKSRSKENNAYNFEENWSSEKKNNDVNEDLKYDERYNSYELIIKKIPNNYYQKLILFQKNLKIILKLKNLTRSLPKWKENLEIFLSKRKTYRKK